MLGGRSGSGTVGATDVVGVLAVRDRVQPQRAGDAGVDGGEQLVLAVVTAIRAVRAIGRAVTLGGLDLDDLDPDLPGHRVGTPPLAGRQAGGDAEHGDHLVVPEHPGGEGQQDGGVDAAGEGDPESSDADQVGRHAPGRLGQRSCWYGEIGHVCHPNRPVVGVARA